MFSDYCSQSKKKKKSSYFNYYYILNFLRIKTRKVFYKIQIQLKTRVSKESLYHNSRGLHKFAKLNTNIGALKKFFNALL